MRARYAILVLACVVAAVRPAAAESWPARPLTMVVPFAAGGGTDVLGRILARRLSEILAQQVIIENVGGAGGMVGSARVAKASPDGYQFVLGSRADAINQTLYKNPLYNFATDLAPVVLIADQPTLLVARNDLPVGNSPNLSPGGRTRRPAKGLGSAGSAAISTFTAQRGDRDQRTRSLRGGGPDAGSDRRSASTHLHAERDRPPARSKPLIKAIAISRDRSCARRCQRADGCFEASPGSASLRAR
jgi:hypothetical protein